MDPLTLALIAGGAQAISALPDIIPSEYERNQREELKKLKRQQELGALGLTDAERSMLENQLQTKAQSSFDAAAAQRNRLLQGGMGVGGADKLLADAATAEAQGRIASANAQAVEAANLQKAKQQEQYMRDLEAAQGEYKRQRADALVSPFAAGGAAYIGQMAPEALLKAGVQDAKGMSSEMLGVQNLMSEWGLTQSQATAQLQFMKQNQPKLYSFYTNPETMTYMSMIGGMQ